MHRGSTVAADNDAILCIGYSAHIRGRILRVDLSLSSLLGMHVRRPGHYASEGVERELTDGPGHSDSARTIQCVQAYTSGV